MATDRLVPDWRDWLIKLGLAAAANILFAALMIEGSAALERSEAVRPGGVSETFAMWVGVLHISFGLTAAAIRASAFFLRNSEDAEDIRREGRALLLGAGALIAAGSSLILLSLAGPGRLIPPAAGLAGGLLLSGFASILVAVRLSGMDELNRGMARESGYFAFTAFTWIGGIWAMLAHLGFVLAPEPLGWLALLGAVSFVAGLVATARRGGFDAAV